MKITYIEHCCFCVEFEEEHIILIFDWYKGELPKWSKDMQIYVFASHKHFNHYSKKVFALAEEYDNIQFILSNEIKMNEKYMDRWNIPLKARENIMYVHKDSSYILNDKEDNGIKIDTLTSTDSGVGYIVQACGRVVYHAGDLNWWSWEVDSEADAKDMERRFKPEVEKLSKYDIDVAFLTLDPRMEERFFWGFDYYMKTCNIAHAFPMHMWGKYEAIDRLKEMEVSLDYRDRIMDINSFGQIFEI